MKKRFDLTAQTVMREGGYYRPYYKVKEPKSGICIDFGLDIRCDKQGIVEYGAVCVLTNGLEWIICRELTGECVETYCMQEKIQTILYNAYDLGWNIGEASFWRFIAKKELSTLLPVNSVHKQWVCVEIEWEKLDGKTKDDLGQLCLPYVEDLLNMAVDYCIKEYWR